MVLQALHAGKHVLVEKPLALTRNELASIQDFFTHVKGTTAPILLTGFNRRFSPAVTRIHELTANRTNPMILNYRMNAGHIPADHWVHGKEGGGRNIGEACHIYDLFTALTGSRVSAVRCETIRPATDHYCRQDNFIVTVTFEDGSLATLTYTALGTSEYPKERLEVFVDGKVLFLTITSDSQSPAPRRRGLRRRSRKRGRSKNLNHWAERFKRADSGRFLLAASTGDRNKLSSRRSAQSQLGASRLSAESQKLAQKAAWADSRSALNLNL